MNRDDEKRLLSHDLKSKDWVGEVVDNQDPESEFRCKIKVFGLFDDLETGDIPWAYPKNNNIFAGGDGGFGSGSVPKIGTIVKVDFNNGNIYSPEYYGVQNINPDLSTEISDDYEGTHVIAYDGDEELKVLYQKGRGLQLKLKGSNVTINPDASITIEHDETSSIIELTGNTINVVTDNQINLTSDNQVNVTTNRCHIDSPNIRLGENAAESVIKGETFQRLFNSHTHIGFLGITTSPPVVPLTGLELSKITKTQ